jgi:hypothetical protein
MKHLSLIFRSFVSLSLTFCVLGIGPAHAAFVGLKLGGSTEVNAYYDDINDKTWLRDANLVASGLLANDSGGFHYETYGGMTAASAMMFADAMRVSNYLGFNDWRLPNAVVDDASCSSPNFYSVAIGSGCSGNEMGQLFNNYFLGTSSQVNLNLFSNVQMKHDYGWGLYPTAYWTGTRDVKYDWWSSQYGNYTYSFSAQSQGFDDVGPYFVWLMRDGGGPQSSSVSAVPEPESMALMFSGLAMVGLVVRRRQSRSVAARAL